MNNNEISFLGGIINFYEKETNKIISAMAVVKHEYFSTADGVNLYLAINSCVRDRLTPDIATLSHKLNGTTNEQYNSWLSTIRELMTNATSAANIKNYAYRIKADYDVKQAINLFSESISCLNDVNLDPRVKIKQALANVSTLDIEDGEVKSAYTMKDALGLFLEQIETPDRNKGLSTGFVNLDAQLQGLQAGNTYPLAGSPGAGKTTLALNISHSALMNNKRVLFYSLEMPANEIITKLVSLHSKITTGFLRGNAPLAEDDTRARVDAAFAELINKHLIIDEGIGLTAENIDIVTKHNEMKLGGIDLIVVDYLTLLNAQGESETVKASNAAKALKQLSKKYNAPVIILSQFVKNLIGRPKKSDLRQTGQLEQDASAIFLLYRDPDDTTAEPIIECNIAKNRWGSVGIQNFKADFARNRFIETQEGIKEEKPTEPEKKTSSMMDWQSRKAN